jgi:hypothetical protein
VAKRSDGRAPLVPPPTLRGQRRRAPSQADAVAAKAQSSGGRVGRSAEPVLDAGRYTASFDILSVGLAHQLLTLVLRLGLMASKGDASFRVHGYFRYCSRG